MKNLQLFVISIMAMFFLNGCVQALMYAQPLLTGAMVGADTYNTYASTKTEIKDEKTEGSFTFDKIAIWPDNECEVFVAENLQKVKIPVTTPAEVTKVINKNNLSRNLKELTYPEMEKNFLIISEKTGADAILVTNREGRIFVYSTPQKKEIWSSVIEVTRIKNCTHLELMKSVANDIANKIIVLKQGPPAHKTSQN
jgi:hypothetical protein